MNTVSVEAVDRFTHALLLVISEDQAKIRELEAQLGDHAASWCALPDWEDQQRRVQSLLDLCDELEQRAIDNHLPEQDRVVLISEIKERLSP